MVDDPTQAARRGDEEDAGLPRRAFGPFRVLERIGQGGMGEVFLAEREEPRQRVAVKVIRADRVGRIYRARFEVERETLARMDHTNIARLYDAGEADGLLWFAMEYVPGQPLDEYCRQHKLTLAQRLAVFAQVCDGVQHAHMKGVLHRDLKPANVLVREIDGQSVAKIVDFGLAHPVDPTQLRDTLVGEVRKFAGTVGYMSPEQAECSADLDIRADVYSLGVVLYELLTGQLPTDFGTLRAEELLRLGEFLRLHEPPKPSTRLSRLGDELSSTAAERRVSPKRLRSLVRGELDWVTMRALAADRRERYATVRELGQDIERFLKQQPVSAGPPSALYVLRKWGRRHSGAVASVAVAGCLATGWAAMSIVHAAESVRLTRAAEIARLPLVASGLLEAHGSFGLASRPADVAQWLEQAQAVLGAAATADAPLAASQGPAVAASLATAVASLERAVADARQLQADQQWLADQEHLAADAWQACSAAIAAEPRYAIRSLPPQRGLVPLGRDPVSGLFEFELLDPRVRDEPHRRVQRAADGSLELTMYSDVVLVLLPGGTFRMGTADRKDDWIEPDGAAAEFPAHDVTVAPFFLAKHELTAAQYCVEADDHPGYWDLSRFGARLRERKQAGEVIDVERAQLADRRCLPQSELTWFEADRRARQFGVRLPTEAEWEYGARAGTSTPWSFPSDAAELRRHANALDPTPESPRVAVHARAGRWLLDGDGFDTPTPVGMFLPNAFGLYDVHGNVWEWCADALRDYDVAGKATTAASARLRVLRGGSFQSDVQSTRSARRREASRAASQRDFGVRLARSLVGAEFR